MSITLSALKKSIKSSRPIYHFNYSTKFFPTKIGKWNKVDVVLFTHNDKERVADLTYICKNFNLKNYNF